MTHKRTDKPSSKFNDAFFKVAPKVVCTSLLGLAGLSVSAQFLMLGSPALIALKLLGACIATGAVMDTALHLKDTTVKTKPLKP